MTHKENSKTFDDIWGICKLEEESCDVNQNTILIAHMVKRKQMRQKHGRPRKIAEGPGGEHYVPKGKRKCKYHYTK